MAPGDAPSRALGGLYFDPSPMPTIDCSHHYGVLANSVMPEAVALALVCMVFFVLGILFARAFCKPCIHPPGKVQHVQGVERPRNRDSQIRKSVVQRVEGKDTWDLTPGQHDPVPGRPGSASFGSRPGSSGGRSSGAGLLVSKENETREPLLLGGGMSEHKYSPEGHHGFAEGFGDHQDEQEEILQIEAMNHLHQREMAALQQFLMEKMKMAQVSVALQFKYQRDHAASKAAVGAIEQEHKESQQNLKFALETEGRTLLQEEARRQSKQGHSRAQYDKEIHRLKRQLDEQTEALVQVLNQERELRLKTLVPQTPQTVVQLDFQMALKKDKLLLAERQRRVVVLGGNVDVDAELDWLTRANKESRSTVKRALEVEFKRRGEKLSHTMSKRQKVAENMLRQGTREFQEAMADLGEEEQEEVENLKAEIIKEKELFIGEISKRQQIQRDRFTEWAQKMHALFIEHEQGTEQTVAAHHRSRQEHRGSHVIDMETNSDTDSLEQDISPDMADSLASRHHVHHEKVSALIEEEHAVSIIQKSDRDELQRNLARSLEARAALEQSAEAQTSARAEELKRRMEQKRRQQIEELQRSGAGEETIRLVEAELLAHEYKELRAITKEVNQAHRSELQDKHATTQANLQQSRETSTSMSAQTASHLTRLQNEQAEAFAETEQRLEEKLRAEKHKLQERLKKKKRALGKNPSPEAIQALMAEGRQEMLRIQQENQAEKAALASEQQKHHESEAAALTAAAPRRNSLHEIVSDGDAMQLFEQERGALNKYKEDVKRGQDEHKQKLAQRLEEAKRKRQQKAPAVQMSMDEFDASDEVTELEMVSRGNASSVGTPPGTPPGGGRRGSTADAGEQIAKLVDLKNSGAISDAEFTQMKANIIAKM